MKLAPGSRWISENTVACAGPSAVEVYIDSDGMLRLLSKRDSIGCDYRDALAAIDAAGFDKVKTAARQLRAHMQSPWGSSWERTRAILTDALCRALDEETDS